MSSQGCKSPTHVAVDTCIRYELQDNEQALLSRWCVSPTHVAVDTDINCKIMRGDTCTDKNCKIMRGDTCTDKNCQITSKLTFWLVCFHGSVAWGLPRQLKKAKFGKSSYQRIFTQQQHFTSKAAEETKF